MKIIEQGKIPGTDPIRATCGNCRTVFEFMPIEAKETHDQRDGNFWTIHCPLCGQMKYVDMPTGGGRYA